ncbi:globin family protein [Aestuariibius insulae]|uniref:globin family protein n=1 Tax=Aestuariibius insulae TaxID=2058287 RepID=UPI00345E55FE
METHQIALVKDSFEKVVPIADTAAEIFYADLFETSPEVKPYFANSDMRAQGQKLMTTLGVVVRSLDNLPAVLPAARDLAIRHVGYGVQAEDYGKVGASLLRTLEKGLREAFTPDVKTAWTETYSALSGVMIDAAYGPKETAP